MKTAKCSTQEFLSKQSDIALFGKDANAIGKVISHAMGSPNCYRDTIKDMDGCSFFVEMVQDPKSYDPEKQVVTVESNGAILFSWQGSAASSEVERQTEIKNGMDNLRNALKECGCTKL